MTLTARWFHIFCPGRQMAAFLRKQGIIVYDLCPFRLTAKELLRIHGHNERISLENLKFGMRFMTEVIRDVAT